MAKYKKTETLISTITGNNIQEITQFLDKDELNLELESLNECGKVCLLREGSAVVYKHQRKEDCYKIVVITKI